jgi:inorganic pyrophosphatase
VTAASTSQGLLVEVEIEIPRGSFLKTGSGGQLDFLSPLPCPFNYGSVPGLLGGEGDLLDAVVLGPRLPRGHRLHVPAWGAIGLHERHLYDDKLICAVAPPSSSQRQWVVWFFHFYARCKGLLNRLRRQHGPSYCSGWGSADDAMARARPLPEHWHGPTISF